MTKIYSEQFTGTKVDRPMFHELLSVLKKGDILVVTKLDRFARSAVTQYELVNNYLKKV